MVGRGTCCGRDREAAFRVVRALTAAALLVMFGSALTGCGGGNTYNSEPTWSPDGSKIAFVRKDGIYVMNADGSGQRRLTDAGGGPAWSPDGSKIAFGIALPHPPGMA